MSNLDQLVKISLDLQGVDRNEERVAEIAIEAQRLISGVAASVDRLAFHDEPSMYAVLMAKGGDHG
jgi:hypothetical protein